MNIIIDGMGGDHAPEEIVKGAVQADHALQMIICAVDQQKIQLTIVLIGRGDGWYQFIGGITSEGESH